MAKVEQKHLEGLVYRSTELKEVEGGKKKHFPTERPLVLTDLTGQADNGDHFVATTGDGRKYKIGKSPKPADGPDKGK